MGLSTQITVDICVTSISKQSNDVVCKSVDWMIPTTAFGTPGLIVSYYHNPLSGK